MAGRALLQDAGQPDAALITSDVVGARCLHQGQIFASHVRGSSRSVVPAAQGLARDHRTVFQGSTTGSGADVFAAFSPGLFVLKQRVEKCGNSLITRVESHSVLPADGGRSQERMTDAGVVFIRAQQL